MSWTGSVSMGVPVTTPEIPREKFMKNTFISGKADIQYRITINTLVIITCMIDDLTITPTFSNPNFYRGSIQLGEGKNALSISS